MTENLPKEIPLMDHEFEVSVEGEITKKQYVGKFKYRIPNLKAKALADKKRAELDGPLGDLIDPSVQQLHYMIAYLRFTLIDMPDWWSDSDYGYGLHDYSVVKAVYDKTQDFETTWMEKVWGKKKNEKKSK